MSNRTIGLDDRLQAYLLDRSLRESSLLAELRAQTASLPEHNLQIAPEQGQFMALLARLVGARRYLEIGTFTGYSALAVGEALPSDGEVVCLDHHEEWTAIARRYWDRAGLGARMDLRLGDALEQLGQLEREGQSDRFDLAFIDADKDRYIDYFESCMRLVRPGGLIMIDNTLHRGEVADPNNHTETTEAIRTFNRHVHRDERIDVSLLPIADGLTLARRRME